MTLNYKNLFLLLTLITSFRVKQGTIDLNKEELIYLANHLTSQECRKLVAYAHYQTYDLPNDLEQAEHKLSKDESCLELLYHWNSQKGEGRGESHEALEHRLRQMEKNELADWLGKTVFRQLGQDIDKGLNNGFKEFLNDSSTTEEYIPGPTFSPPVDDTEPTAWLPVDSVLFAIMMVLLATLILICLKVCHECITKLYHHIKRKSSKTQYKRIESQTSSSDDEEEKFDVRNYK